MFSNLKQTFNAPNTSFGFSSNVTPNPFGQTAFGKTPSTGFGAPAPAFGQQSAPLFGQTSQHGSLFASAAPTNTFGQTVNAQPTFGSGMFGNASSQPSGSGLFGAANTSTFGQQNKSTGFGFGTNTANTGFGFGQSANQVQPQQQSTGLFGQTTSNLFGQSSAGFGTNAGNNQIGTVIKFTPVTGTDTMVKGSINQTISTRHHCITCMKEYENKSLEELRWEDYQVNRKGPQQGAQPAGGLFGNMSQPVGTPLFGSGAVATSANTLFGQQENKSVFGQTATATGHGQYHHPSNKQLPLYQSPDNSNVSSVGHGQYYNNRQHHPSHKSSRYNPLGAQNLKHSSYPSDSHPPYPASGAQHPSYPQYPLDVQPPRCSFNPSDVQPPENPYYPGFGQTAPAFGATPTSNTGAGLFGKPLTGFGTATTSSAFPFSSTAQTNNLFGTNTAAKPAFGVSSQPNSLFGQPSGFGNQSSFGSFGTTTNQNVGLFNQNKTTPFSIMPTSTANTFGSFAAPAAQNTNPLFSGAKPNTGFGGFGQTNTAPVFGQPSFGQANQGGLFNSSFNKTATPLFGQTQTTNTLGTGLQMGGGTSLFGSNVNKPNTMFGNNLGLFNSGFGTSTNTSFNMGGNAQQPGVPNQDQSQTNSEQQIISMSSTPYGIPNLLNNISEVGTDLKDCTRPTNPGELNALLNTVSKTQQTTTPTEKLKPVQVFGRKVPMFDGLEHRDESLISNIRINNNPKRLIVRNHPNKNKDSLDDSLIRSTSNPIIVDSDYSNVSNRSLIEDLPKERESLYPDLRALQKEMSPALQKSHKISDMKNTSLDITTGGNLPISSTMITSPSKALFLPETNNEDDNDSREEDADLFAEASESQDWQTDHNDSSIRGVTDGMSQSSTDSPASSGATATTHPTGIILTRPEYYTVPSLDELVKYISEDGSCVVKGFTVGRYGYGNVYFSDAFDVSNLNLDELVHFRHKEINIYPDDSKKPPQGQGLNRRAQVTLDKVWPLDKKAKALVTDVDILTKMDYAGRLRRLCEKQNTRFVEYRPDTGSWVFKVEHFSKYGLRDSNDEEGEVITDPTHPTGIILTRPGYYTVPSLDGLIKYISEDGSCIVKGFTIGRHGYGNVYFYDAFDVSNLNLDELVHFNRKEIIIYPDDSKKPIQGQGLNRRAQITLDKIWPLDKQANSLVTDVDKLIQIDYASRLRRLCEKQNTHFVEYKPGTGSWIFKVEHFTRYGNRDSDDEAAELILKTSHPAKIILTRPDYYTVPSLDELVKYIGEDGSCVVKGFTIGRHGYGNVQFFDAFDVSNLNFDEFVHFQHKKITIYPDDSKKPPQGQGLNRRAQVTLDKIWPMNKKTNAVVTDVDKLTAMDYADQLKILCEKQNTRFVEYKPDTGSWVFQVDHFSKYGHRDSDDEEEIITDPEKATPGLKPIIRKPDSTTIIPVTESDEVAPVTTTALPFTTVIVSPKDNLGLTEIVDFPHTVLDTEDTGDYAMFDNSAFRILDENAKCTLMKSTFFEKEVIEYDDSASDVCSSEGGILELSNYVSKSSPKRPEVEAYDDFGIPESEYVPLDICEDEIPEPMDKPEVVTIDASDFPNVRSVIKNYHNLGDMIAFKGRSFRVGWTKQSTMLCLAKNEFDDDSTDENTPRYRSVAFKKLINTNVDWVQNLERHLECQYNCSAKEERDGVPYCFPFYGNAKLHGHQCIANDLPKDNYEKQIWDLIATLFDYPEQEGTKCSIIEPKVVETCKSKVDKIRKNHLSRWIKTVVESTVDSEVNDLNTNDISKILSYISGNKIDEAAELAMSSDNINLAMLISQLPIGRLAQVALQTQLSIWENCDVYDHLDETVLKIYAILSGNTMVKARGKKILVYERMDWIRILALYFWYVIKREAPLSDAVNMYEKMFEDKLALPPSPEYEGAPENIYDLRFHLLKYYSDNGHPLIYLLNTFTHTNDPLDYRLSWFVFQTLQALNQDEVSTRARNHMHINFATQLEQMGLWHWAAYILTYIENNSLKRDMIETLLGRHVKLRGEESSEYSHRERMVIHKFRIPQEWVEHEKAIKALQKQNYKDAVYYLCYARKWKKAHEIIMKYLIPEHLLSYEYVYLIDILTPLSEHKELLSGWEEEGGLILDFAKLGIQYNKILSLHDPVAIKKQLISFRSAVINVSVRFKHFTPLTYLHDVCLAEMSGRIAVMLRKLLTIINGHTYELCVDTAINAQTLPMTTDYLKQELNSILIDFLNGNQPKMIYL